MSKTNEDVSFFVYGDSINTDAFDNAQNSQSESGEGFSTASIGDAGLTGVASGEGGTCVGNSVSAGMGI